MEDAPRTPILNNTRKEHLLRIVRDERAKLDDGAPIVAIGAADHHWSCHSGLERLEDLYERRMIKVLLESPEIFVV